MAIHRFHLSESNCHLVVGTILDGENRAKMKVHKSSNLIFRHANIIRNVSGFSVQPIESNHACEPDIQT